MPAYEYEGVRPVVDPTAFVHDSAVLIGDVIVGPGVLIGPGASLRGDIGRLIIGRGANVQDNCVLHCFPGKDTIVEENGHVGHGAVIHGCTVGRNAMVGIHAVVMDDVEIGAESIVAAMAFVREKTKIPPRSLVMGIPAKVVRELTDEEVRWKTKGTEIYQHLAERHLATSRQVQPLTAVEPDRRRVPLQDYQLKSDS